MRHFSLFLILEEINASLYASVFENYQYRVSGLGLTINREKSLLWFLATSKQSRSIEAEGER